MTRRRLASLRMYDLRCVLRYHIAKQGRVDFGDPLDTTVLFAKLARTISTVPIRGTSPQVAGDTLAYAVCQCKSGGCLMPFLRPRRRCLPCPSGASCAGGSSLAADQNWWQGSAVTFYHCQSSNCCPSGSCQRTNDSSLVCATGIDPTSTLCSSCLGGQTMWYVDWRS